MSMTCINKCCNTCTYFIKLEMGKVTTSGSQIGECHAVPPGQDGFPTTYGETFCGKYMPRDTQGTKFVATME